MVTRYDGSLSIDHIDYINVIYYYDLCLKSSMFPIYRYGTLDYAFFAYSFDVLWVFRINNIFCIQSIIVDNSNSDGVGDEYDQIDEHKDQYYQ